jgi:hypothetical protein
VGGRVSGPCGQLRRCSLLKCALMRALSAYAACQAVHPAESMLCSTENLSPCLCAVLLRTSRLVYVLQQEHELVVGGLYEYAQDLGRQLAGVSSNQQSANCGCACVRCGGWGKGRGCEGE